MPVVVGIVKNGRKLGKDGCLPAIFLNLPAAFTSDGRYIDINIDTTNIS